MRSILLLVLLAAALPILLGSASRADDGDRRRLIRCIEAQNTSQDEYSNLLAYMRGGTATWLTTYQRASDWNLSVKEMKIYCAAFPFAAQIRKMELHSDQLLDLIREASRTAKDPLAPAPEIADLVKDAKDPGPAPPLPTFGAAPKKSQ